MSNPALGAGSDLDGLTILKAPEGRMYIPVVPLGQPHCGIILSSKCGSMVGGGLPG